MKKLILLTFCVFGFALTSQAQSIADNALGLRLGDNDGFGTEISYQRGLSDNNRLEFDLGWRSRNNTDAFRLTGLYQWVWNIEGGFNWYAGAGAGIGSVDNDDDSDFFALVAGDVGIEYDFDFPLLISLDFRPEIGFNDYNDDLGFDIALGVRYQF
ncbi:hypothetical protein [Salinimicrobium soli]|uniref:hypothetical protein n=1 Tax=Salinimicrobium soli TaxID=1254399 RepID=UPI003AAB1D2A